MDLVKLGLAAEGFAQEHPSIVADSMRCVRASDKSATCKVCEDLCPMSAIQVYNGNGPIVNADSCVRCGLCLHRCPTGTFDGDDGIYGLLSCAFQLVYREILEIACAFHPDPAAGHTDVDAAISTNGCLAAFGPSTYIKADRPGRTAHPPASGRLYRLSAFPKPGRSRNSRSPGSSASLNA